VRQGKNILVLRTFSKIYALAGLRIGYGMARPGLIAALHQVREPFNVSSLALAAAVASLRDPEQVERGRRVNEEGRGYLGGEFKRLGLRFAPTQSNFVFVDLGVDAAAAFQALMRRGVIVRHDPLFGTPTHVRVTIGTMQQNRRFIAALEEVLAELRA
jgi:histidinol-phosphate aminotransferase